MIIDKKQIEKDFRKLAAPLCDATGPAGFEEEVTELIKSLIKDYKVEISSDVLGNLIVHKNGNGSKKQKVLVSAHVDEIALIVRHIDSKGFLWVETLGGFAPQQFFGKRVVIKTESGHVNGIVQSIHPGRPDKCTSMPESVHDFFIEVGAENAEEVSEMGIEAGNSVSICYPVISLGKYRIGGKAMDDRALVFILLETLKLLENTDEIFPNFYAVFSTQEEIGARGAIIAATNIKPDYALALDMSLATDIPKASESIYVNSLGKGTSIKVMDKLSTAVNGIISDRKIVSQMKQICKNQNIPYQIEAYAAGATDASFIQTLNGGIKAGGINLPMRYVHSYEVVDVRDVVSSVELLYHFLTKADL